MSECQWRRPNVSEEKLTRLNIQALRLRGEEVREFQP